VVVTTKGIRHTKLQSNRHHQQTDTQLFTGRMPFLSPNQQCQALITLIIYMCLHFNSTANQARTTKRNTDLALALSAINILLAWKGQQ